MSDFLCFVSHPVYTQTKAEESPSAILLAQSAIMYTAKRATRRATLLYFTAANRLEKCGIVGELKALYALFSLTEFRRNPSQCTSYERRRRRIACGLKRNCPLLFGIPKA
jgi:hypothetical protein